VPDLTKGYAITISVEEMCRRLLAVAQKDEIAMEEPGQLTAADLLNMATLLGAYLLAAQAARPEAPNA
jgi:hypothetical protein